MNGYIVWVVKIKNTAIGSNIEKIVWDFKSKISMIDIYYYQYIKIIIYY